ncbi:MAG: CatB-related O-acetyltransferase [Crocinitomicaceae bacterium]
MKHFIWKQIMKLRNPSCKIESARLAKNIKLGKSVNLGLGSSILAKQIGDFTFINKYCLIDKNVVSIGKFCSIAYNVRIGLGGHPTSWLSTHPFAYDKKYGFVQSNIEWADKKQDTIIGNDVWIGANATILAGVTIGDGAIIGAHSLVNKDVEPYSIVIGTPAKHLRYRFDEKVIKELLDAKWWNLAKEDLIKRIDLMKSSEKFLKQMNL